MTLTEFLLARIAEDEEGIRDARITDCPEWWMPDAWSRDRALAECEAKRRIVEARRGAFTAGGLHYALQCLALPYADHPDYRYEWKP